jgi:type III secretion protein U
MSDEQTGEKTEQPTAKKLRDSKKKGQVAQSKQAVSMVIVIVGAFYIYFGFGFHLNWLNELLDYSIGFPEKTLKTYQYDGIGLFFEFVLYMILPLPALLAFLVVLMTQLIAGGVFSFESLKPKPEKFNPVKNIKNMFSVSSLYKLLFGLTIALYAAIVGVKIFDIFKPNLTYALYCGLACEAVVIGKMILYIFLCFAILFIVFIILDIKIEKMIWIKNLKMTKDEVKREYKQNEGDPLIKSKRRQIARENIQGLRLSDIAFVIAGSEIVLGFVFDRKDYPVPFLAFKARSEGGKLLVQYAKDHKKPVEFSDALVQKVIRQMKLNSWTPQSLYPDMIDLVKRHKI